MSKTDIGREAFDKLKVGEEFTQKELAEKCGLPRRDLNWLIRDLNNRHLIRLSRFIGGKGGTPVHIKTNGKVNEDKSPIDAFIYRAPIASIS